MLQGRVVKVYNEWYRVAVVGDRMLECKPRGRLRKGQTPLPGDRAMVEELADGTGVICEILPRRNLLLRPAMTNVDQVLIIQTWQSPAMNLSLLDRMLALAEWENVRPYIVLNKSDLYAEAEEHVRAAIQRWRQDYQQVGYDVFEVSSKTGDGIEPLKRLLEGKVTVMAGPSGVGKSSLLNHLLPQAGQRIGELSEKIRRGKHTTRHVELIRAGEGDSWLADSPGFSRLSVDSIDKQQLDTCFPEIRQESEHCRFRSCLHEHEPDCAVMRAVDEERIRRSRYEHYLEFLSEIRRSEENRY